MNIVTLHTQAPALTGAFYCFNHPKKAINQPSIPGTFASISEFLLCQWRFYIMDDLGIAPRRGEPPYLCLTHPSIHTGYFRNSADVVLINLEAAGLQGGDAPT